MLAKQKQLFIFGSTGDLVKRKVIPALSRLKDLDLKVITLGRKNLDSESYRSLVCGDNCSEDFIKKHVYSVINFEDKEICRDCNIYLDKDNVNYFYSALPPKNIGDVIRYVGRLKYEGYPISLLIEKPFGSSLKEAISLKKLIDEEKLSENVLISDHYLFKKEVMNLPLIPFKKIKIVSLEKVGLENRISYYDGVGALKDMIQSHFLNIFLKLLKNSKEILHTFEIISYERAQYGNGIDEGYVKDLGKSSDTETFVKVNGKVGDINFEFVTGKKFDEKISYISIDDDKIILNDLENPYIRLFEDFLSDKREGFLDMETSMLGWELTELIQLKESRLSFYKEGSNYLDLGFE